MSKKSSLERFVKDFALPIPVVCEPYFQYYLYLYNGQYSSVRKYWLYLELCNDEEPDNVFSQSAKIKSTIVSSVRQTDAYQRLQSDTIAKPAAKIPTTNMLSDSFVDRMFISLDMRCANFNAMKDYDPSIVLGYETYEDLIKAHTEYQYFIESKRFRQSIFGELLPTKQQQLQLRYMSSISGMLTSTMAPISGTSDETIFETNESELDDHLSIINGGIDPKMIRVTVYTIKKIGDFYVKEFIDGASPKFMGVPSYLFAQVFKHYYELPVNDYDMMFYMDGHLAKFQEPIF